MYRIYATEKGNKYEKTENNELSRTNCFKSAQIEQMKNILSIKSYSNRICLNRSEYKDHCLPGELCGV